MHIVHLALAVDAVASVLLDMVDFPGLIQGGSRDERLQTLFSNYREWCEATSVLVKELLQCLIHVWDPEPVNYDQLQCNTKKM